ncbi:MAG: hypothetical protein AAFN77_09160 [Planctomycetota bacterium]
MNHKIFPIALLIAALVTFSIGCNEGSDPPDDNSTGVNTTDPGEHVHADGSVHKNHSEEGHAHGPGPHGGTIVDWGGGKYHVEFVVDHDEQKATAFVLGSDEKTPTPIDAAEITLVINDPSLSFALKASPLEGEGEGKSSRFIGEHEGLGVVREYEGSLSGLLDGTPYSGTFKE